jgi:hypothetical protein
MPISLALRKGRPMFANDDDGPSQLKSPGAYGALKMKRPRILAPVPEEARRPPTALRIGPEMTGPFHGLQA